MICGLRALFVALSLFVFRLALCAQSFAYVMNSGDNTVSVIATPSNTVVATVRVGILPVAVAVTPDGTLVYVVNYG
jgi:YVTN family beta-propeller protein